MYNGDYEDVYTEALVVGSDASLNDIEDVLGNCAEKGYEVLFAYFQGLRDHIVIPASEVRDVTRGWRDWSEYAIAKGNILHANKSCIISTKRAGVKRAARRLNIIRN